MAERFANVKGDLPANVSGGLAPISTPLSELFMFTIEGPLSLAEKRNLLDWTVRPQLRAIPGVADVNSLGGRVATFGVSPDPAALAARGVSYAELRTALETNTRNDGAGRVNEGEETWVVRVNGGVTSLEDLRRIGIKAIDGVVVTVGDVAQVELGEMTRYGAVTQNGKGEAVEGLVIGLKGVNAGELIKNVKTKLEAIQATLPKGVTISTFYDRAQLVDRAVGTVSKALLEAAVLVVILLILFLGNLRAAIVVALILPLSVLATFVLMRQSGLSANLMSLGGLAIAIGLLVDAAVVVVENIVAHLAHAPPSARPTGPEGAPRPAPLSLALRRSCEWPGNDSQSPPPGNPPFESGRLGSAWGQVLNCALPEQGTIQDLTPVRPPV